MANAIEVHGIELLRQQLRDFPVAVRNQALRRALRAAGKPVLTGAKARVSRRTGNLRRNLRSIVTVNRRVAHVRIGFRPQAFYGRFLETGTVNMRARPFLRPTAEEKKGEVIAIFSAEMRPAIQAAIRRHEFLVSRGLRRR